MTQPGFDINLLFEEAQVRWLKPAEVLFILKNHDKYQLTPEPPQRPASGSLFLFNKRVLRFFRRDGHNWRKKKDGRTVGEAHERLKVGNVEALNCYYAHGEQNPTFQRRSFWMLDPAFQHIVLVHYRETGEGKPNPGYVTQLSPGYSHSPSSHTTQTYGSASAASDLFEQHQNFASPGSIEVSSNLETKDSDLNSTTEYTSSTNNDFSCFFRKLEEQLSLNEDIVKEIAPFSAVEGDANDSKLLEYENIPNEDPPISFMRGSEYALDNQQYGGPASMQLQTEYLPPNPVTGELSAYGESRSNFSSDGNEESISWNDMLESYGSSSAVGYQEKLESSLRVPANEQQTTGWLNFGGTNIVNSSLLLPNEVANFEISGYPSPMEPHQTNSDYCPVVNNPAQFGIPVEADSCLTISQQQKFTIHEIAPEWGYATETTKVIIAGSFLCDPSECTWTCMFGDTEVPLQTIQEGVLRCEAPPHLPEKVTLCITSSNRESCSEIREFEYRAKDTGCSRCSSFLAEDTKSPEELLLLVRFVQMLLSDSTLKRGDSIETGTNLLRRLKSDDDLWGTIMEALLVGTGTSSNTVYWLMHQLLKDRLQQWLSSKSQEKHDQPGCLLSKKEQGIIHIIAGLGFEWALPSILSHGVSIDFRDINGWTALHWAARFGREKMVAALLASGASAGAVTDPSSQDPIGKTPASVAATSGHKGLAGYLSEVALTSHLSSLTLEESELFIGSAEVEAEITLNSIPNESFTADEDHVSFKQTLAAVRNSAQAAARIQSAFRAHSFRKRMQRESARVDEYGIATGDILGLSAISKLAFRNAHDYDCAALSIQKKYRGWKGRKDFLALRQKVVKIQAHVRGYQVRKHYEVICWAVGVLDKVVLRWRRKGVGLRGFRSDTETIDESDGEDILKVFRRQKVDGAVDEAVSRVLSMVDSPDARQQYHRMLERYRVAKAELGNTDDAAGSSSLTDASDMENDLYHFN